jgi:hypothetical protein
LRSTATAAERPEFLEELLAIREDPVIKSIALRWARDPDLAKDARQEAYCAVARVRNPGQIKNLRAYYRQTLFNVVNKLRDQLGATCVEDFGSVADAYQHRPSSHSLPPRPVEETVSMNLLARTWLRQFAVTRAELAAKVPGRSPDPDRYRGVIVSAAERVVIANVTEDVSDADSNQALRAAYPEWFAQPGCTENTYHQRCCRARADVRDLLRTIISRDDLYV